MAEAGWFYAQGDEEKGPVSSADLKGLATSGQLKPTDLVWKDGLDDWMPASEVKGLFPKGAPAAPSAPAAPAAAPTPAAGPAAATPPEPTPGPLPSFETAPDQPAAAPLGPSFDTGTNQGGGRWRGGPAKGGGGFDVLKYGRVVGQPMLLVGLFLVLVSRGCDSIGNRGIARIDGKIQQKQNEMDDLDPDETDKREDLADDIKDLRNDLKNSAANNMVWGYWREWMFMFGTIVLSVGLLAVGFTHEGAARWICLIMLAIITFSVYVGGLAFINSVQISNPFR